jgi:hypothetical protein
MIDENPLKKGYDKAIEDRININEKNTQDQR